MNDKRTNVLTLSRAMKTEGKTTWRTKEKERAGIAEWALTTVCATIRLMVVYSVPTEGTKLTQPKWCSRENPAEQRSLNLGNRLGTRA